jgi:hypothetical protein
MPDSTPSQTHRFIVDVLIDPDHPTVAPVEAIRLRLMGGPQYMDGVLAVTAIWGGLPYECEDPE